MAELIFPDNFDEKCTIAQDDLILMADSEDGNKIKKAKYSFLKGETGTAATIEVGCVCTGAPGTPVCINNSGTCSAAVLNFTIPKGDKGDTGCTGPAIICAEFDGNNIDFTEENGNVVVLEDAKICLQGPQGCTGEAGNGICCATLNPDYTLTLQYTNGCCDTTGSIRGEQGPQGCEGPQGCTGATGNGICCIEQNVDYSLTIHYTNGCSDTTGSVRGEQGEQGPTGCTGPAGNGICCMTSTKAGKVTTVELQYTCGGSDCFSVCDGQDGQGSGDMLACVYDPNGCAKNVFDYDNLDNTPDLSCYQEKLTAGNGIDITSNTVKTTYIYGESDTAAATVQKEVSIPSITELNVGQVIIVKPTVTSTVAASTLKLNSFPAYKMLYNAAEITTSTDSIVWGANIPSMFYLDEVSGTKYWRFLGHGLDSNSTYTLNQLLDAGRYKAGTGTYAITKYSLCMMKADGTWEKITATNANYSTATTKNVNTNGFVLNQIKYYNTTTAVAGGAFVATNTFASQAATLTLSYSFNCGTAPGRSVGDPIYIVGTIGADGLFYLDTTARWSTALPNTNDGKLYIRIGTALAADNSTASFLQDRPIFYYDNGIKEYTSSKQDKISDLDTIRAGAACGASALQSISCGDVTTALGYTPAQSCDIPTDNCQLCNSCGYTTCTGTLTADNICDTSFGNSWDGVTTKAPSMNAIYDVLGDVETLLANI